MTQRTVAIDPIKFRKWAKQRGLTLTQVSRDLGCGDSFISKALMSRELQIRKFELLQRIYAVSPDELSPDFVCDQAATGPWSLDLTVKPDRVRVSVRFNGAETFSGWSNIRGKTELDLMQAISYAAHMCYKQAEQKNLGEQ